MAERGRVLDPVSRANEILFGLIMVLTFTLSLHVTGTGAADVRAMLVGAIGCNIAWGIIDAAIYLMGARGEGVLGRRKLAEIRAADPAAARALIAADLPPAVRGALGAAELEQIRTRLVAAPEPPPHRLTAEDWRGAVEVFLLVTISILPVILPFVLLSDDLRALRMSNFIAVGLLFLSGYALGRETGQPLRTGLAMVAIGLALLGVALLLGG